jgi:hypothetical protein
LPKTKSLFLGSLFFLLFFEVFLVGVSLLLILYIYFDMVHHETDEKDK